MNCDRCKREIFNEVDEIARYVEQRSGEECDRVKWLQYRDELAEESGARVIEIIESSTCDAFKPFELAFVYCNKCLISLDKWRVMEGE
jgi:hypothetical protein